MTNDNRINPAATGFDTNAEAYERARPPYPPEAVAYIVGHGGIGPGRQVLDLAAGTGKLTAPLAASGAAVVAVEPVAGMRDQLVAKLPAVEVRDGTAEALPVPDDSVDAITVAQAFHWFDAPVALAEMHRALRPGGHLFLVWNTRDRSFDWLRQFGDLITDGERPYDMYYDVDYAAIIDESGRFGPVSVWSHAWEQPVDEDLLVARAESVSVVGAMSRADRAATLERIRNLARTHPELASRRVFGFPYTTMVWHAQTR